jgi:hypothetical protein
MELPDFVPLEAKQGDTFLLDFVLYEDDGVTPEDVTGYEAEFSIAVTPGGTPLFTYTQDDYITVGTTDGAFDIQVPFAQTKLWTLRRYMYEVSVTSPGGVKETLFEGRLSVRPEVVDA